MKRIFWDEREFARLAGERVDVVAIGDSWFWYPIDNLLNPISNYSGSANILCFGANGATSQQLASGPYFDMYSTALRGYGSVAAVLISAGGNDFAGFEDFQKILRPDCSAQTSAGGCFAPGEPANLLGSIRKSYQKLISEALAHRPKVKVLVHNYDYAIPNGLGFLGLGQWLKAPMNECRVPNPDGLGKNQIRRQVICILIDLLGEMLNSLTVEFGDSVCKVKTSGTIADEQWANDSILR